jgi:hypothetical protein
MKVNNISFKSVSVTNQCCSSMLLVCVGMKIVLRLFEIMFLRKTLDKSERKLKVSEERCIMRRFITYT